MPAVLRAVPVGNISAQHGAGDTRTAIDDAEPEARLSWCQAVRSLEEDRDPGDFPIAKKRSRRTGDHQKHESAGTEHRPQRVLQGHLSSRCLGSCLLDEPRPPWILQGGEDDYREDQSGQTNDQERVSPPHRVCQQPAYEHPEERADGNSQGIEGKRRCPFGRFDEIGNQGVRGGCTACFTNAHADPCQQKLGEILRQSAQGRHRRPDRQRPADEPWSVGGRTVREPCNRQSEHGVEQRECQPGHQSDLRVAQAELHADRFGENIDDLPIDEIEDIDDQQDPQCNPHRPTGLPFCRRRH